MSVKKTIPPPIFTLRGHQSDVTALHLIGNLSQPFLVTGDLDGVVIIWNLLTLRIVTQSDRLSTCKIMSIKQIFQNMSNTASYLVVQSREGFVKLLCIEETRLHSDVQTIIKMKEMKSYPSSPLLFSRGDAITIRDNSYLAHSSIIEECQITLRVIDSHFETVTSAPVKRPATRGSETVPSCFDIRLLSSPEENLYILCGYEDGIICLFSCRSRPHLDNFTQEENSTLSRLEISLVKYIDAGFKEFIASFDYCSKSSLLLCGSPSDRILLSEVNLSQIDEVREDSEKITSRFEYLDLKSSGVSQITLRPDVRLFAVAMWNTQIRLYSTRKLKLLAILSNHSKQVNDIIFIEDKWSLATKHETPISASTNYLMICASSDKTISIWSLFNGF